jgi:hypothetical protein
VTEAEWSISVDPERMLSFIRDKGSERKLRLFACGAVRRIWPLLTDERLREAIVVSERHADGQVSNRELGAAIADALEDAGCADAAITSAGRPPSSAALTATPRRVNCLNAQPFRP